MKAVLCRALGGPETLTLEEMPDPVAGPGEVVVRVRAAALNFFDTLIIAGTYQTKPELPFSPCGEIAGIIDSIGTGVVGWLPGQRVMAYLGFGGAREKVVVSADRLTAIPAGVRDEVACGIPITYGTALHGLRERAHLQAGETVVVLGAAGGAGLAAIEVAKLLGARVVAVASTAEKLAICREHGADETVSTTEGDLKFALRELAKGLGVDVVYDCVGGTLAEPAFRALAWQGRYLVVGFASGTIPQIPFNLFLLKGAAALGVFWGEFIRRNPSGYQHDMSFALDAVAGGRLTPHVDCILPLDRILDGFDRLSQRRAIGKVIVSLDTSLPS
jgi:NADPH:quinone reductase